MIKMPSKYQVIVAMAASEAQSIVSSSEKYMAFLTTAANTYKYSFQDQLLIHAQKPGAIACADIDTWNRFGRWVNRGTKGIALLVDTTSAYRLRYVFDLADTNSRVNKFIPIWQMQERYEEAVKESLGNSYGEEFLAVDLPQALIESSHQAVADNLADYLRDLQLVTMGSFLEELDQLNLEVWLRSTVENSIAFMLLQRCGYDAHQYFMAEDFAHVLDFNTHETLSILGTATSSISEMILRDIEETIKGQWIQEQNAVRTFETSARSDYDITRTNHRERRSEYEPESDLYNAGRLPDPRPDPPGVSEGGQVRETATQLPEAVAERSVHRDAPVEQAELPSGGNRPSGEHHDGAADEAVRTGRWRDGEPEGPESDAVGAADGELPQPGGSDRAEGPHLQLSGRNGNFTWDVEFFHQDNEQNELLRTCDALKDHRVEIAAFFADHRDDKERGNYLKRFFNNTFTEQILSSGQRVGYRAYDDMFHMWRGSFMTREREVYHRWSNVADHIYGMLLMNQWLAPNEVVLPTEVEQIAFIDQTAQEKAGAFVLPQAAIDYVVCRGSNVVDSKYRIYDQFLKKQTPQENIDFLKNEYGWGGSSNGIPGTGYWEQHDTNGITISRRQDGSAPSDYLIRWTAAEKRIRQLIDLDRYLTPAEKKQYVDYTRRKALREQRTQIATEFKSIVDDFNDYQEQLGNQAAKLDSYILSSCAGQFTAGQKTTWTRNENNFILPLMREAMNTVIDQKTHLTERCMAVLDQLNGDLAKPMEPTYDELNPPKEPPKEYQFKLGDPVRIGMKDYEVLAIEEDTIRLFDPEYPLFNQEMSRSEFLEQLTTDTWNDRYLHAIEEPEEIPQESAPEPEVLPIGRISYLHTDGRVRESVEYTDVEKMEKDLREENFYGVPMQVVMYVDRQEKTVPHRFVYDMDPPLQGVSVIMNPHIQGGLETSIEKAKRLITEFCESEYQSPADFSNMRAIAIGHTTITDAEIPVQVYVNLEDFSLNRYVDGVLADQRKYDSLEELIKHELECLDFNALTEFTDEQLVPPPESKAEQLPAPPPPRSRDKAASTVLLPSIPNSERSNFRIQDDALGVGTPVQRYTNNVAAIRLLKQLEAEERLATPEEQEVLSQYVGWGGLSHWFDDRHPKYLELKSLLTEEEYTAARASTLTAFYTPPVVIRAMYQALENMNFRNGNILEPSCGVGNFLGMIPDSMSCSKLYGVELDSISGRIAQQLYQKSSIAVQGYEKTNLPDSFFDAAIGNVPFGQFKVSDKRYDKHHFLIHDYFFARTLDKVRPGGIIAFITSKGTMDKENPAVRRYIAQRADLLGAIRLPNNTFKDAAGTEVTSDIIFLQKRDRLIDREPDWVHLSTDSNGLKMNSYFVENPDMILGEMKEVSGPYGPETACVPYDDQDLGTLLSDAIQNIHADFVEYDLAEIPEDWEDLSIPADPAVRNFSYTIVDGTIYYRENSRMHPVDVSMTAANRIKGLIGIRDCVRKLIDYQTEDYPDSMIQAEQARLNELYDAFNEKYGRINTRANSSAFNADSSFCLLSSLEIMDDEGNFRRKADMFSKRTIRQKVVITSVDTASEALALSLAEKARIDMEYMSELTGKTEEQLYADLQGVIFLNPGYVVEGHTENKYLPADEYLSGNVREKLSLVKSLAEHDPEGFAPHVQALKAVQPVDLTASEISIRLGATWLPTDVVEDFMFHLLETPRYMQWNIHVHYSQYTGEWNIEGKSVDRVGVKAHNAYGTGRINAYKIIEETLNLKDVRIFDYLEDDSGKRVPVLNKKETAIAQGKQELIKQAFADWIWNNPSRRERLTKLYNEKFNSIRPREYDGSHLTFPGMNPEITLRPHQVNAIAHILYGGNTLLAHVVGAGKTFEMVAAAQESKRLGLCRKSLFVVPNHLTEQWASEYLQLYPSANILVATKKDFEARNRKRFCARIATGDYDAVIIGHSQFEKIPMSVERQRLILERQLEEIINGITELKHNQGAKFSVKQLEKAKKTIKAKLDKLNDQSRKDDLVTFEELGIDRIFVDEAHYYKNLAAFSKMRNVGGISQTEAQKSSDLYMKCRYLDEITGGRGIIFATGTPISNSMVEMYTMQKYLQYDSLRHHGLLHFDAWASTFGETVTAIELAPEGSGYRSKTRFARFYNLPELMAMFKEVADIQTADMLKLPVPEAHYHHEVLKPSEHQKNLVASLSDRAERVRNKMVSSSEDNMLLITNDGRKLALDQRLVNSALPDSDTGKVAACADNVHAIWERTTAQRSTQMIFCDLSTPHNDGKFNVYDDLRTKLIARGIPADEIAFIHSAGTEAQKKELFGKVRSGQIRILLGSTQKMGAGTNCQHKLISLHHLDCPWRPSDLQQREGRIIRQGNENPEVDIYTYVTENTFDSYLYQLVESKQKFIGQVMTSKSPVRSAEDIDETALSYAEIKALCTGNPYIKEKMDLEIAVQRLRLLKSSHLSQKYSLEDRISKEYPCKIAALEQRLEGFHADMAHRDANTEKNVDGFSPMLIDDVLITEKKAAGTAILAACQAMTSPDPVPLGQYRGFSMSLSFDSFAKAYVITMKNELTHTTHLGTDIFGNIQRLDNLLDFMGERMADTENLLANTRTQLESARVEVAKPFPQEDDLRKKTARLEELNVLLDMDKPENEIVDGEVVEEPANQSTKVQER